MKRIAWLLIVWLALARGTRPSWAKEEGAPAAGVTGAVLLEGKGVPARVHLTRRGDIDPLYNSRWQFTRQPATAANELALELGATADEAHGPVNTDETGRFSLGALEPGGYVAWVDGPEGRLGSQNFSVEALGQSLLVEVELRAGHSALRGRIVWADDVPYRGHVVLATRYSTRGRSSLCRCETDAQGLWSAAGIPDGRLQLVVVTTDGTVATSPLYEVPGAAGITWTLESGEKRAVRGFVQAKDDGTAIASAIVEVEHEGADGTRLVRAGRSGADGAFALSLRGQPRRIAAFAGGFRAGSASVRSDGLPVTLQLGREHGADGRVVAKGSSKGVPGARVRADKSELAGPRRAATTTDATGRFVLPDLAPSEWMVFAMGDGWVSDGLWKVGWQTYNPFTLDVGDSTVRDLTREVVPAGRIEGRVVDDAGEPVAGALVRPGLESTPASDDRPLWAIGTELPVASGRDGTFSHRGLLPGGLYVFKVSMPGFPDLESEPVLATPALEAPLTLRLSSRRWLRVVVRDKATGAPVVGARVEPFLLKRWGAHGLYWSRATGSVGAAFLGPLPAGPIAIEVDAAEHEHPASEPTPVPEAFLGTDAPVFQVTLNRGRTLAGRVTFPEGTPRTGFRAEAYRNPGGHHEGPVRSALVDETGSFELRGLRAAGYSIVVQKRVEGGVYGGWTEIGADAASVTVEVKFHLDEERTQAEAEREPPDPYAGQRQIPVQITTPRGDPLGIDGMGRVQVLPEQSYASFFVREGRALIAVPRGAAKVMLRFHGGDGWDPAHGAGVYGPFDADVETIAIQLSPGHVVRGRVLDHEGKGLPGVRVSVLPVDPMSGLSAERYAFWYSSHESRTDAEGRYVIRGLRDGDYEIAFATPPEFILPDLARFTRTDEERVLRLRRGVEVAVLVLDDQGKPYPGAEVQARRLEGDAGHEHWELLSLGHTDRDGIARLVGLDPELPYRLAVDPDSDRPIDLDEQRIHDWRPAATTVQLARKPPAPR